MPNASWTPAIQLRGMTRAPSASRSTQAKMRKKVTSRSRRGVIPMSRLPVHSSRQLVERPGDARAASGLDQGLALVNGLVKRRRVVRDALQDGHAQRLLGLFPGDLLALAIAIGDHLNL